MPVELNPFRYVAEQLIGPAGENLWPLAILWFDAEARELKCSVANVGAALVVGQGQKIGRILDDTARELCEPPVDRARTFLAASGVEGE